jgi:hypothetical protein
MECECRRFVPLVDPLRQIENRTRSVDAIFFRENAIALQNKNILNEIVYIYFFKMMSNE